MRSFDILHTREVPLHRGGVHLLAVVEEYALAQSKGIGQEVWGDIPCRGHTRDGLRLLIQVDQALCRGGQDGGDQVDGIAVRVEPCSIAACGKTQCPTPLGLARTGCDLADESAGHGASQGTTCGGQEGTTGEVRGYRRTRDVYHLCIFFTKSQKHPHPVHLPVRESTKYPSNYAW